MLEEIFKELLVEGKNYPPKNVHPRSRFNEPIRERYFGYIPRSRNWGDIDRKAQAGICGLLCSYFGSSGSLDNGHKKDIAFLLCLIRVESGFNPSACAMTTSASGLGQFVRATAKGILYQLGLKEDSDIFNITIQLILLNYQMKDCFKFALKYPEKDFYRYAYKYHHDGGTKDYGGLEIADKKVIPMIPVALRAVEKFLG